MIRFLSATFAGLLLAVATRAADVSTASVVYFVPGVPGIVQFQITLDGKPVEPIWAEAIDKFFAYLDRDSNGTLDENERAVLMPQPGRRRSEVPMVAMLDSELAGRLRFEKAMPAVDKAGFADALKSAGFGPVSVQLLAGRSDTVPLTNAIFKHLDANGDGKLAADEFASARERLEFLDVNEDEWLTTQELLARAVVANRTFTVPTPRRQQPDATETSTNDFLLLNGQSLPAVKQLLAARGKAKANTLTRAELGMSEKAFAEFDRDGNGQLDTDELLAWLKQPPLLSVTVNLTTDIAKLAVKPHGITMAAGTRFDVSLPSGTSNQEWIATSSQLKAAFKGAAKQGVIEKANLKDQPLITATFAFLDRNGDGKLEEKELTAAMEALAPLAVCRANISIFDQGRGLLDLIDNNRDGQLSQRELAAMPTVVKGYFAKDGTMSKADVPRLLAIQSSYGGIRFLTTPTTQGLVQFADTGMTSPRAVTPQPATPAWFQKMDRNADGDVSRKEFLGPLELFKKLDADSDGLISAEEAKK